MRNFEFLRPTSLDEAISLLQRHGDDAKAMAGGQSVVLLLREGLIVAEVIVSLAKIPGLDDIEAAADALTLGGLTTHRQVEKSPAIREHFPFICEAYPMVATVPVRNIATIGGNLCHNAPGSDPPAWFIALDATVTLRGPEGERTLTVEEFGTSYYETALKPAEILTSIRLPLMSANTSIAYYKYATRPMDMALVGVATRVTLEPESDQCAEVRVALSGVAPTTLRARNVEAALRGQRLTAAVIAEAAALAAAEIEPMSDGHASAEYRRKLTVPAARRMLTQAWRRAQASSANPRSGA